MAKIAIISDIHANIHALNLVLKDIEAKGANEIICLGDLVTKYFYPKEVVDIVRENASLVIKGNCDNLVVNYPNYKFAREKLGISGIEYLDNIPKKSQININNIPVYLYHSSPNSLDAMFNPLAKNIKQNRYKDNMINEKDMFIDNTNQVVFVGHTHQHYIGKLDNNNKLKLFEDNLFITPNDKVIVNVGSAGEHNYFAGNEDILISDYLTYALVDNAGLEEGFHVEIVKVPYKETLKDVYMDMISKEKEGVIPNPSYYIKKIEKSINTK